VCGVRETFVTAWMRPMAAALALACSFGPTGSAQQPVLQRGYDANVTGANLSETELNASNIGPSTFGLLFKLPVDEKIFAQPLYVPNVTIPNYGTANVVYIATMNDTLYAFDADTGGSPLWSVNLASLVGATAPVWANFAFPPFNPPGHLGILSTPVIDPSTNVLYVVACTLENSTLAYRLHAIDITTGAEPYGPGVLINAIVGADTWRGAYQTQRASLVLSDNQVIIGFAAMLSERPGNYLGYVLAYNEQTLVQVGAFSPVITGNLQGGVWQSGRPPAVDSSGYVYAFTGNSHDGGWNGTDDFSESALKLDPSNGLNLVDWFTSGNWQYLDDNDLDLSASGPLLIPGTSLVTGGGKYGTLYVLDTADLGGWTANDSTAVQAESITNTGGSGGVSTSGGIFGGPVYWVGSAATGGPVLYDWGVADVVKAFPFNGRTFATSPSAEGMTTAAYPGGILTLSANGSVQGSGVLWASTPGVPKATPPVKPALHALNAENVAQELWNSTMNAARDAFGNYAMYVPPTVANGKVYLATASMQVAVYGLLSSYTVSPTSLAFGSETTSVPSAPLPVTVTNTGTAALPIAGITITGKNEGQFSQSNTCGTSVATGANCTINVVFKPTRTGSMVATLTVNAGNTDGSKTVTLGGTGVAQPFTVSTTSLAFGNETTGVASAPLPVTVTNTGTAALPIAGITITGTNEAQFTQTNNCGASVAVGAYCKINVVLDPKTTGAKSATLTVNSGAADGTQTVKLSGTGT
jgi:PQQ enzyme repeat